MSNYHFTLRTNSGKKKFKELVLTSLPSQDKLDAQIKKLFRIKNKSPLTLYLDHNIPEHNLTAGTNLNQLESFLDKIFLLQEDKLVTHLAVSVDGEEYQSEKITEKIEIKREDDNSDRPVLFWRDTDSNGYLSNWKKTPFELDGITFNSIEQSLMYHKAIYANQNEIASQILGTASPQQQKRLGRQVNDFLKGGIWRRKRCEVLQKSLWAKFTQNPELGESLKKTYPRRIAEASPSDTLYGIGLAPSNPLAQDPKCWKGQNLLGKELEKVRDFLLQQDE